jgi:malonyl-CoA/methylmalonyl-CoA synthetase
MVAVGSQNILSLPVPCITSYFSRSVSTGVVCWSRLGSPDIKKSGSFSTTPLFLSVEKHLGRTAIIDHMGQFTYDDLLHHSMCLSQDILALCGSKDSPKLEHDRVGFLCENDASYVVTLLATWMVNGIAVPLCKSHPASELEYFVQDSGCSVLVASQDLAIKVQPIAQKMNIPLHVIDNSELTRSYEVNQWFVSEMATSSKRCGKAKKTRVKRWYDLHQFNNAFKQDPALIIYTSGTTGRPKVP